MKKSGMRGQIHWGRAITAMIASMTMLITGLTVRGIFIHENGVFYRKRLALFCLLMLLCVLTAAIAPEKIKRWRFGRYFYILTGIAAGGYAFQYMTCADDSLVLAAAYIPLTLSLTAVIFAAVWLVVWDARRAVNCFYWLMCFCAYAYECIYRFRGVAFKPMDIFSFRTALEIAGGYSYPLEIKHLLWYMGGVLLWTLAGWVPKEKMRPRVGIPFKTLCVCAAGGWIALLVSTNILSAWNVSTTAFEQETPMFNRAQGTLTTLVKECQQLNRIRPEDYNAAKLTAADARLMKPGQNDAGSEKPNILIVVNESLADLQSFWKIETDCDPLAYLHSMNENTVWGNLFVSAYGGSTCNTEHSFLTATIPTPLLNMPLLSTVRENTPSLPWAFKANGYQTIALHPHTAKNYQRDVIYPRLGFDTFYSLPDFEGRETVRELVSDRACYDMAISLFEKKAPEDRLFVYTLTLQNHSRYTNLNIERTVSLNGKADEELANYLNLLAISDRALEHLITYFEAYEEPVVILFFGDHQPKLDLSMYAMHDGLSNVQQQLTQFITPFVIWANYPIQSGKVDALSVNYLAPMLLKAADLPMTGYDEWLLETAQEYPVAVLSGYADPSGLFASWDGAARTERLNLLDLLRYNRLYDAENRLPALERIQ